VGRLPTSLYAFIILIIVYIIGIIIGVWHFIYGMKKRRAGSK